MSDIVEIDAATGEVIERDPTAEEAAQYAADAAAAAQAAATEATRTTNRRSIEEQAAAALATNRAFVALSSPTNAQTLAQVKALARQNNGVIRLLLDDLTGTD
jgi:hypothetical protein